MDPHRWGFFICSLFLRVLLGVSRLYISKILRADAIGNQVLSLKFTHRNNLVFQPLPHNFRIVSHHRRRQTFRARIRRQRKAIAFEKVDCKMLSHELLRIVVVYSDLN